MSRSLLEYAQGYAALGWRVFPLHGLLKGACACGRADCPSPAKHPVTANGVDNATTDPAVLGEWFGRAQHGLRNIGLRVGDTLVAIDVDVGIDKNTGEPKKGAENWAALVKLHGQPPETIAQTSGSGGTHMLFTVPPGVRIGGSLATNIDTRHGNQYIVVEPSVHITGGKYEWEGAFDPLEGMQAAPMPDWMLQSLQTQVQAADTVHEAVERLDSRKAAEIESALRFVDADNYDQWLDIGMALHSTGAGTQAKGIWETWSAKSPSFKPKTTPAEIDKKWRSFGGGYNGRKITLSTLFGLAKAGCWDDPNTNVRNLFNNQSNEEAVEFVPPEPAFRDCTTSKGGALFAYLEGVYGLPRPLALAAGIAFVCATASRRYADPSHAYIAGVCPGDTRAQAKRFVLEALESASARPDTGDVPIVFHERLGNVNAVCAALAARVDRLYIANDITVQAQTARRQPGGNFDHVWSRLADLIDEDRIRTNQKDCGLKGTSQFVIEYPALSMLMLIESRRVEAVWDRNRALPELMRMSLYFESDEHPRTDPPKPADWIVGRARSIIGEPPATVDGVLAKTAYAWPHSLIPIVWPTDMSVLSMRTTAVRRLAKRIAVGLAVWDEPAAPVVTHELLAWTADLAETARHNLKHADTILTNEDGKTAVRDSVLRMIGKRETDGASEGEIVAACKPFRNLSKDKRSEVLAALVSDCELERVTGKNGRAWRYYASKIVAGKKLLKTKEAA